MSARRLIIGRLSGLKLAVSFDTLALLARRRPSAVRPNKTKNSDFHHKSRAARWVVTQQITRGRRVDTLAEHGGERGGGTTSRNFDTGDLRQREPAVVHAG